MLVRQVQVRRLLVAVRSHVVTKRNLFLVGCPWVLVEEPKAPRLVNVAV